jgi:hypothetical protein
MHPFFCGLDIMIRKERLTTATLFSPMISAVTKMVT